MRNKAIFLDLDNTLYEYLPCHKTALQDVENYFYQVLDPDKVFKFETLYSQASQTVKSRVEGQAACHHRLLYFQNLLENCKLQVFPHALNMHHLYWNSFQINMKPFPGMKDFIKWCKKNFEKIVIVTDLVSDIQHQKIERLGLTSEIDYLVTSEEAGCEKPHASIYKLACLKAKADFSEVVMIGDSVERDVEGARKLGIKSFHFKDNYLDIMGQLSHELKLG